MGNWFYGKHKNSISYAERVAQLEVETRLQNGRPVATKEEIDNISSLILSDEEKLAVLEELIAPRLEYKWRQAGGHSIRKFSEAEMESARKFFSRS